MGMVLLSAAYGWFAGLLSVMIVMTLLFGVILFIALRPAGKGDIGIQELLSGREAEITSKILNAKDEKTKEALTVKLSELQATIKLINELMGDDEEEPKKKNIFELLKGTRKKAKDTEKAEKAPRANAQVVAEAAAADAADSAPKTAEPKAKEAESKPVEKEPAPKAAEPKAETAEAKTEEKAAKPKAKTTKPKAKTKE